MHGNATAPACGRGTCPTGFLSHQFQHRGMAGCTGLLIHGQTIGDRVLAGLAGQLVDGVFHHKSRMGRTH